MAGNRTDHAASDLTFCTTVNHSQFDQDNFQEELDSLLLYKTAKVIREIALYFIYPSGLVTNTISFFVMNMRHNRKLTTCLYLCIIAVGDNMMLLRAAIPSLLETMSLTNEVTSLTCKAYIFSIHILGGFCAYSVVFMTLERFCAVIYPHKTNVICTRRRVHFLTFFNAVVNIIFFSPLLVSAGLVDNNCKTCARYKENNWHMTLYSVFGMIFYPIIPVLALFGMNFAIVLTLCRRRKLTAAVQTSTTRTSSKERQITLMLLLVSVTFVVLLLPFQVKDSIFMGISKTATPSEAAMDSFSFSLTYHLMLLNHAINFYLYLISGAKFRADLMRLFGIRSSSGPSSSVSVAGSREDGPRDKSGEGNSAESPNHIHSVSGPPRD